MESMIERVAKAIYKQQAKHYQFVAPYDEIGKPRQIYMETQARAAIEAMREPTDWMCIIGMNAGSVDDQYDSKTEWQAMIDVALTEEAIDD